MSQEVNSNEDGKKLKLTTDGWAVLTAHVLALLVRIGAIRRVPC